MELALLFILFEYMFGAQSVSVVNFFRSHVSSELEIISGKSSFR